MTRADKIVRVIDIDTSEADRHHYKIYLTTFADYSDKAKYKIYGNEYRLHPYKWYELQRLWTVPSYWLLLKIFRNERHKITRQKHSAISTIVFITEMLSAIKVIIELIDNF